MRVETLISTMYLDDIQQLLKAMRIQDDSIVVNQHPNRPTVLADNFEEPHKLLNSKERGLSRSRNIAIANATGDICLLADDDLEYVPDYTETIKRGFDENPEVDIIAFRVDKEDGSSIQTSPGKVGLLRSMKISSVQIAFRRQRIVDSGVRFNENFGAGTENYMGEENIFLADCIRAGLKIYSQPKTIAHLGESESTWFEGFNKKYFVVKGRVFRQISPLLAPLMAIRFAIKKRSLYRKTISPPSAFCSLIKGLLG